MWCEHVIYIIEGIPVSYKDVESIDPDFAKSLQVCMYVHMCGLI